MSGDQPEPGELGVAGALLAELEADGELVGGEGRFTIDAIQARTKLRDYQLASPEAYALLLVEAAVLARSDDSPIEISSDFACLRLWIGPVQASRAELEQLFAAAFVDLRGLDEAEVRRRRVLQKLAFACNAALRLEPAGIIIQSVGAASFGLRLAPDAALGEVADIDPGPAPGDEAAKAGAETDEAASMADSRGDPRAGEGLWIRVAHGGLGTKQLPEADLLRERCQYASRAISLDGARIDRGRRHVFHVDFGDPGFSFGTRGLNVQPIVLDGVEIGLAGFRYGGREPAQLSILTLGVLAERLEFGDAERPAAPDFTAVVDVDLAKDLSQSRVLRGPAFDRVIDAVWAVHDAIAPKDFGRPRAHQPASASAFPGVAIIPLVLGFAGFTVFGMAALSGNTKLENFAWLLLLATAASGLFVWIANHDSDVASELDDLDD